MHRHSYTQFFISYIFRVYITKADRAIGRRREEKMRSGKFIQPSDDVDDDDCDDDDDLRGRMRMCVRNVRIKT